MLGLAMTMPCISCQFASVFACPYCQSDVGKQVSAGIFNDEFWINSLLTISPFLVLLLIIGLIHFGLPRNTHSTGVAEGRPSPESRSNVG